MTAVMTKLFDDDTLDELKSAAVTPRGIRNTMYVLAQGGVTSGVCELEASSDKANWVILATRTLSADGMTVDTAIGAHRYLRLRISTIIAGGTLDGWILSAPPRFGAIDDSRDLSSKAAV